MRFPSQNVELYLFEFTGIQRQQIIQFSEQRGYRVLLPVATRSALLITAKRSCRCHYTVLPWVLCRMRPAHRSSPSASPKTSTGKPNNSRPTKASRSPMSSARRWSDTSKQAAGSALTVGTRNQPHGTTQLVDGRQRSMCNARRRVQAAQGWLLLLGRVGDVRWHVL